MPLARLTRVDVQYTVSYAAGSRVATRATQTLGREGSLFLSGAGLTNDGTSPET